jgi:dTDP-glucose pyrophosphorylase
MMRTNWRDLRVEPAATVRETMKVIDRSRVGLALVVEGDRLVGTVTDGDVRRAILREVPLEAPVREVMYRDFAFVPQGSAEAIARDLMQARQIKQVPVLAADGTVVGFYYLPDLLVPSPRPNWVVIMAGGQGRRLRPLTEDTPKPMLPVGGQPLLEVIIRRLVDHGFRRLFLSVNYRSDQIESHFADGSPFNCHIEYLREDRPLDTGGALALLPEQPTAPVLVVNGDVLTDVNFSALLDYHTEHAGAATVCVREYTSEIPYGVVKCRGDLVVAFEEKPVQRFLINAGIYLVEPKLLIRMPAGEPWPLTRLITDTIAAGERIAAFVVHEQWHDIGHPADYERVRNGLA